MTAPTRPALRYHGGKWRLAPWIIENFPADHRVYVEPFGGGGSVLLRKPRSYAEVYNDLDGELVNLFRMARDRGVELQQARRTVVRSFMGFGSNAHGQLTGFRNNSNRSGTTPAHDWANYPDALELVIERLRGVVIERKDAVSLIEQMDGPDTLFYVDPPYLLSTRNRGQDYRHEMTDADHEHLARTLHDVRGCVALSGYPSPLYASLFQGWQCIERRALADGAKERIECLWLNPACSAALLGQRAQQRLVA